ncbi:4Fe-4S double cluster binding domain-containing protein [Clostridium cellulovorans]|uniref:Fe-S protein-like protein n=1 Tax=Clostridium cellulovorans (strain ATCC 35296 / DSM 3052 / OCM 3 / 743B) TaxID=573061 RepID=D9SV46_CLOC7|nr:4Fe-4S double cluster binding domain-containing protein [Clostridium cellulovorans]ADL53020.1 Fe-S protein-like protein [Clostridium cellulovorans 743B]
MSGLYNNITEVFKKNSDILFGISNIEFSEYKSDYKCALVLAVPHAELLNIYHYKEDKLENLICNARDKINLLLEDITTILEKHKVQYYIPPVAQSNEETLLAPFSFKFASVNAGLGWIGKNGVLITEMYGPRVRLSAILINSDLPIGNPITKSKCPPECNVCIDACPHKALTGHPWNIATKRETLIDYKLCNKKRSLYIKTHNRKHSCGLCLLSCPIGI